MRVTGRHFTFEVSYQGPLVDDKTPTPDRIIWLWAVVALVWAVNEEWGHRWAAMLLFIYFSGVGLWWEWQAYRRRHGGVQPPVVDDDGGVPPPGG